MTCFQALFSYQILNFTFTYREPQPAGRCGVGGAWSGHRGQVPRGLGGRGDREDSGDGVHHHLHPEAAAGDLYAEEAVCR